MICAPLPCLPCIATETAPVPTRAPRGLLPNATRAASVCLIVVNRELAPGDGTNPLLLPIDSLLYFRSLPPISGISRDDAESEIESWRIELRLARSLARSESASTFCPRFAVAFNCSAHNKEPPRSVAAMLSSVAISNAITKRETNQVF